MTFTVDTLVQRRDESATRAAGILDAAELDRRALTTVEAAEHSGLVADVAALGARIEELRGEAVSAERTARARLEVGEGIGEQRTGPRITGIREPATYSASSSSPSFVADLYRSRQGDYDAAQRLQRNQAERNVEQRALGNSGGAGGAGGEWSPPLFLENEGVLVARAGRVTADRCVRNPLPPNVSQINIPKITGAGTVTAPQTTQNTIVASVDPTTAFLSSGITTIAGSNILSLQLIQQSALGSGFDKIVLQDLAADLARNVDRQVLSGTGTGGQVLGLLNVVGAQAVPFVQATPSVTGAGGFYAKVNQAISLVASARFLPPDAIVMRPERWSWVAASFDSTGRPLVSPSGNAFNQISDASAVAAQGPVGSMAGLPVFVDANLPLNGTSQDPVIVARFADLYLWESDVTLATFDAPYANSLGVLVRAHGYLSAIMSRYPASIAIIQGTGTAPASF